MSEKDTPRYKRTHCFIDKRLQKDFVLKFIFLVFLGGLLTAVIVYFLVMQFRQSTTVAFLNSRVVARPTGAFVFPIIVQTVGIMTIAVAIAAFVMSVLFTHKISGPLYRFKKVIEAAKGGDLSLDFRIRQKDQLHDLAGGLNDMIRSLKQEICRLKENISALKIGLSGLSEEEFPENKRLILKELKRVSEELDKLVHYFKT